MLQKKIQSHPAPPVSQEIEIRVKTSEKYLKVLELWLSKNATFQGTEHHKEFYLDNPNVTFFFTLPDGEKDAMKYLRIRYSNDQGSVCLKDWHRDSETGKTTHCDEYETNVSNPDTLLALLEQLGYKNKTLVQKTRKKFIFSDYEIVIDEVKNCGTFIEVELKKVSHDVKSTLQELEMFLANTAGVKQFWLQTRGYVSMLRNPERDYGEFKNYKTD